MLTVQPWRDALEALHNRKICSADRAFTYREIGAGDALVFLHGISSGSASWVHQLMWFGNGARCIAWDAPGYGESSAEKALHPSAVDYAEAFERFLNALKIERIRIVAHSLGALMATAFAAKHSGRVRGMVLLAPAIGYGSTPREEADAKLRSRLAQLRELGVTGLADTRSKALVSKKASCEAVELIRWNMLRLSSEGYAQAARMLSTGDIIDAARQYSGPVLVACGTEDTITPEQKCKQAAAAFANGRYVGLDGLGHASHIEDPLAVNQTIAEFLMGLPND